MDIEQLTKHQIVLLTLLVSFVSSIATGIVTVSLMDQAPPEVTKVVNQIVEHTVETVMPQSQNAAAAASAKTPAPSDDELMLQAISAVQKSIIRITASGGKDLVARGVIIGSTGIAVTDADALKESGATSFDAILSSGERVPVGSVSISTSSPLAQLMLSYGTTTAPQAAKLASPSALRLGQAIIRIGGVGSDVVGSGVIASLPKEENGLQSVVQASVSSQTPGSVLMTRAGEVIGITTKAASLTGADFYSILNISAQMRVQSSATSSQS